MTENTPVQKGDVLVVIDRIPLPNGREIPPGNLVVARRDIGSKVIAVYNFALPAVAIHKNQLRQWTPPPEHRKESPL